MDMTTGGGPHTYNKMDLSKFTYNRVFIYHNSYNGIYISPVRVQNKDLV